MQGQLALSPFDASLCRSLFLRLATEGTIDLNEKANGLVVIGFDLRCAFEKFRRALKLALGKTGPGIKVMAFE